MCFNRRPARFARILSILLATLLAHTAWAAAPEYHLTDLGTLGGRLYVGLETVGSAGQAVRMNNAGQVVGIGFINNVGTQRGFLYQNGVMSQITPTGGNALTATAINDLGAIAGEIALTASPSPTQYFVLASGVTTVLPIAGLNKRAMPTGLANDGTVYGSLLNSSTGNIHAFIYTGGSTYTDLGTFIAGNDGDSAAGKMNQAGVMTGYAYIDNNNTRAFIYQNGTMSQLGTLASGLRSTGSSINASNTIVGSSTIDAANTKSRGFIYRDGLMTSLGIPTGPGLSYTDSYASDINDDGTIVGAGGRANGDQRAFLWRANSTTPIDLSTLVDSSATGWTLNNAHAINNAGAIIGQATRPDGNFEMYMLTPLPEPASITTFALLSATALIRRRSRR